MATERERADVRERRWEWIEKRQPRMRLQPARLVFIDETALNTKMTRLRGRSRRGGAPARRGAVRALGHPDLYRRAPMRWAHRALGGGRRHGSHGVQRLCRDPTRPNPSTRRCRDCGQSLDPQERPRCKSTQGARRLVLVSAAVFARSEPHRERLRQAEGAPARGAATRTFEALWAALGD